MAMTRNELSKLIFEAALKAEQSGNNFVFRMMLKYDTLISDNAMNNAAIANRVRLLSK